MYSEQVHICIQPVGKVRKRQLGEYLKTYPTSDMCTKQWTNTKLSSRCKDQKYVTFTFIELPQYIRSVFAGKKSDQYQCQVLIYVKTKFPPRCHSAHHLNIYLYWYNVNAFGRPPVHCWLTTQLSMLFRTSLNKSLHIKIAAKFHLLTRSTVLEQKLGTTMMKCRLHWYITLVQARRRATPTLPRFINRMQCIRENLVWLLHVCTKEPFYQPPFLTYRRISTLQHYTLHAAKKISERGLLKLKLHYEQRISLLSIFRESSWLSSLSEYYNLHLGREWTP